MGRAKTLACRAFSLYVLGCFARPAVLQEEEPEEEEEERLDADAVTVAEFKGVQVRGDVASSVFFSLRFSMDCSLATMCPLVCSRWVVHA